MTDAGAPGGWFAGAAATSPAQAEHPLGGPQARIGEATAGRPEFHKAPPDSQSRRNGIDVGILLLALWIATGQIYDLIAISSSGISGPAVAITRALSVLYLLIALGLALHKEIARVAYLVLATIALFFILLASVVLLASASINLAFVVIAAIIVAVPMVFLTRRPVRARFH